MFFCPLLIPIQNKLFSSLVLGVALFSACPLVYQRMGVLKHYIFIRFYI